MPPKIEDVDPENQCTTSIVSRSVPGSPPSVRSIPNAKNFPFLNVQEPYLLGSASHPRDCNRPVHEEACGELVSELAQLARRVDQMLTNMQGAADDANTNISPVLEACKLTLRTRIPLVLKQASLLIESYSTAESESAQLIGKLRASLALVRVAQYVETIDLGMHSMERESIDQKLQSLVMSDAFKVLAKELQTDLSFRVSPWLSSSLALDIPAGRMVRSAIGGSLPIFIEVEPVVEFRSDTLLNGQDVMGSFRTYSVVIEKFTYTACEFSTGAGVARVTVRLSPMKVIVGDTPNAMQLLGILEARA